MISLKFSRIIAAISVILILFSAACSLPEEEIRRASAAALSDDVEYQTVRASYSEVTMEESLDVYAVPARDETLRFAASDETPVYFLDVSARRGANVREGDVLARLDTKELDETIEGLEQKLFEDEKDLSVLDEKHGIEAARNEILNASLPWAEKEKAKDRAEKEYQAARALLTDRIEFTNARLAEAKTERENYIITAPFDGKVVFAYQPKEGEKYRAGMKIVEIADLSLPVLRGISDHPEKFEAGKSYRVKIGEEEAEAVLSSAKELGLPEESEEGERYTYFILTAARNDLNNNKPYRVLYETKSGQNALTIPTRTLYRMDDRYYVYCLDESGARVIRYVEVGVRNEYTTEIISGLTEGEEVISE